jgi:zinc transport system permease protein
MDNIFQYTFFNHALIAAALVAIACGIIGTYIVSRRIVFISGGISHASFGGIGMGYYLGINPLHGAAIFAIISALGIEFISSRGNIRQDSAIGILWSFGMALGILFIFLTPGYAPDLMTYLFGSILTVGKGDLYTMLLITGLVILFFGFFFQHILAISFDPEFAKTRGLPVQLFNYLLIVMVALTIVFLIRIVGIILVISLLTIPQSLANMISHKFKNIIFLSIFMALAGSVSGLFLSYEYDIPSGATIILTLVSFFILGKGIEKGKKIITKTI